MLAIPYVRLKIWHGYAGLIAEVSPMHSADKTILRALARQLHEIANLDEQRERREMWRALNDLNMKRPMVAIDQIPWHEMDIEGELVCRVSDPFWRGIECELRRQLYRWKYMPADMVVEDEICIPKAISDSGFGLKVSEDVIYGDSHGGIAGHAYHRQIDSFEDIEKLHEAVVTHDVDESARRLEQAHDIFDGIMPVRLSGGVVWFGMWDRLIELMGVEQTLYDMIDRPEFIHAVCERWTQLELKRLDSYEKQGLLDARNHTMHCTYTYNSSVPGKDAPLDENRARDCWTMGMAQIFVSVSPAMHCEFELEYARRFYERFGLVNYGCCEPLHNKIDDVLRYIPNARKISISPWADVDIAAERIGRRAVLTRKPNPVYVSSAGFNWEGARSELEATLKAAARNGCAVEFVLKDLSSVGYKPQNLFEWEKRAMEMVESW